MIYIHITGRTTSGLEEKREEGGKGERREKKRMKGKFVRGDIASLNYISNIYFLNKKIFANSKKM